MSREVVVEMSDSVGGKKRLRKIVDFLGFVASGLMVFFVFYGMATVLFSTFVNRAFHHPKECTITAVVAQKSGSKSSSSSSTIYIQSPDCSDLEFQGDRWGLSDKEVVDQIRQFKGQKVVVEVGVWQVPLSPTVIVGIEGLELSR